MAATKREASYTRFEARPNGLELLYLARDGQAALSCQPGNRAAIKAICKRYPSGSHGRREKISKAIKKAGFAWDGAPYHGGQREGAGRPLIHPEGQMSKLTARVPDALLVELDKRAKAWTVTRSAALVRILREALG